MAAVTPYDEEGRITYKSLALYASSLEDEEFTLKFQNALIREIGKTFDELFYVDPEAEEPEIKDEVAPTRIRELFMECL